VDRALGLVGMRQRVREGVRGRRQNRGMRLQRGYIEKGKGNARGGGETGAVDLDLETGVEDRDGSR